MVIISHPTGNANVREAAKGLALAGLLRRFYTSIAAFTGSWLYKLSGIGPLAEIRRRSFDSILQPYTKMLPWYEAGRLFSAKLKLLKLNRHEKGIFSVDNVYLKLDQRVASCLGSVANTEVTAVYSYEDGAAFSFTAAKKRGITCLYDLPIGYWRTMHRMLEREKELHPTWAATLTGFNDSEKKLARKDEELRLADHIFVASSFTASTLQEYPGKLSPVTVIPYGFPPVAENRVYQRLENRPLKLLFVGGLSQRKGIANLFEAVEAFENRVELTIVGSKHVQNCNALDTELARHHWIPSLSHADILKLMQEHDVFVFPSLFEGFGLVITEAMSQGTPVITTERTAGPDLITDNENGWLIEAGNTAALQEKISYLLQFPEQLERVGKAALESARQRPWNMYGKELANAIIALKLN